MSIKLVGLFLNHILINESSVFAAAGRLPAAFFCLLLLGKGEM